MQPRYTQSQDLQTQHSETFIIISGNFSHSHIILDSILAAFHQVVDCPRNNKTIDFLYANVRYAYRVSPLQLLGKSHHSLIYLQPQYTPLVRRQPVTTRSIN